MHATFAPLPAYAAGGTVQSLRFCNHVLYRAKQGVCSHACAAQGSSQATHIGQAGVLKDYDMLCYQGLQNMLYALVR
jgi:hypothetical protein